MGSLDSGLRHDGGLPLLVRELAALYCGITVNVLSTVEIEGEGAREESASAVWNGFFKRQEHVFTNKDIVALEASALVLS